MKRLNQIIFIIVLSIILVSCESKQVKDNRKTYMKFLEEISDAPEFVEIKSEKVNTDDPPQMYFIVELETKYKGEKVHDKVKIEFIGDYMIRFDGVPPSEYRH